ncbi:MAG: DNA methyltransferase, partial [Blastocatellia bacterium]
CGRSLKEATSSPDEYDLSALEKLDIGDIPKTLWYPTTPFPDGVNTRQPIMAGITTVDKVYTPRGLWAMAHLWNRARQWPDPEVRDKLLFTLTSLYQRVTVFSEFRFWGGSGNTANFNVPAIMNEQNIFRAFERKANTISWYFKHASPIARKAQVSAQSASRLAQLPDKSVDYVFTDPPFGGNINYSEMNFLWESWLQVYTDNKEEAIINKAQKKGFDEYRELLSAAFSEVRRVLKDNGWLTIVFHNSSERVWVALQKAISEAGFKIRGTQTFDKEHGTFKQFVSNNAVGYDLVIHCRKSEESEAPSLKEKSDVIEQAKLFVRQAVSVGFQNYIVHYLHVRRGDEFDYRKLYANWLASALPESLVSLSFDEFRGLADEVLRQKVLKETAPLPEWKSDEKT